jgi:competence protein ComEC
LSAQLFVAPWIAHYFNKISTVSVFANLLIVPLAGILLYFSFALMATNFIPFIASFIGTLTDLLVTLFVKLTNFFASLPISMFYTPTPSFFLIASYYGLLISVINLRKKLCRYLIFVFILFILCPHFIDRINKKLTIEFIDVDHGDAILITTPKNKHVLIDTGGSYTYNIGKFVLAPYLHLSKITTLQALFITHFHFAHYLGALELLKRFKVKEIYLSPTTINDYEYKLLQQKIKEKKIKTRKVLKNDIITIDGLKIKVLNPKTVTNNLDRDSLALLLTYKNSKILLTSDMKYLHLLTKQIKDIDIFQIPSHGKHPLNYKTISSFKPKYIIISTDKIPKSTYKLLRKLKSKGIKFFSTSIHGLIKITINKEIKISTFIPSST